MPTLKIEVCANCGKQTCDGGIWKMVSCISKVDGRERLSEVHPDNLVDCTLRWSGVKHRKAMTGLPVYSVYTRDYDNWVTKSRVTLEKIEA